MVEYSFLPRKASSQESVMDLPIINNTTVASRRSPLHELCRNGNLKALQEYVCDLDATTLKAQLDGLVGGFEHTLLHVAAFRGHSEVLDFLIAKGGDVNHQNAVGCTPLHVAASQGNEGCVRVLLKYSSDVFRTDHHGKTPKQSAKLRRIVRLLTSAGKLVGLSSGIVYYIEWHEESHTIYT